MKEQETLQLWLRNPVAMTSKIKYGQNNRFVRSTLRNANSLVT